MLNLLAITYNNIGPFKDKPISIFFESGKYLIKAPIGTGKSFLFFDGPMYGLYKTSARNMLNNQSKEGTIKLLFEHENETRLVTRTITKAKSKESCSSKLYKLQTTEKEISSIVPRETGNKILQYSTDIQTLLNQANIQGEEISFKNETDLQQTLQGFLPPKEVFLNTVFLMQDSENIFELVPSERLNVLKNVFGLLGIDEAKDLINDKKREVTYKLKAYTDTSKYDEKIKTFVSQYLSNYDALESEITKLDPLNTLQTNSHHATIQELRMIQEKISIQELDEQIFSTDITSPIEQIILDKKNVYQSLNQQLRITQEDIQKKTLAIDAKRQERISIEKTNDELIKKITSLNPETLLQLKAQKQSLRDQQESLEKSLPQEAILNFLQNKEYADLLHDSAISSTNISLPTTNLFIQHLTNKGKSLQEEITTTQLKIKNEELLQTHEKQLLQTAITSSLEKETTLKSQLTQIQTTLQEFEQNTEAQATFACEKIQTNCPFIKIINKKTFDQLELQKQQFLKQETDLKTQLTTIATTIADQQTKLSTLNQPKENTQIESFSKTISDYENKISIIKNFLVLIDWKTIQTNYTTHLNLQDQISTLDKQISLQETLQQQIDTFKQQKEKNEATLGAIDEQITTFITEKTSLETSLITQKETLQAIPYETLLTTEKLITTHKNIQRDITVLIGDYKSIQIQVNQLKEEEKQLNNLYTIFSKELLLLVLQDHLPVLNDIINNYLSQIVDYQINLSLNKTNSEKLELEANIIDKQGEREIRSLSGGQKIILKLVWMIAISSYMNSPILFLDETINNLDIDTVSKVADMLEDFVKQRNMKLYTVTHNQQIQDMNIRDETVEIVR